MKQLTSLLIALVVGGLFAPLFLACAEDKANAPPPSTGAAMGTDDDGGAATAAPSRHGGGW